jgi:myo-inositol-hexaphosphate 3-phosphohydrolase
MLLRSRYSEYRIFRREGAPGDPHDHSEVLKVVAGGADQTDGIEVTPASLGPAFPNGMMLAMNSGPRNFLVFRWEALAVAGVAKLKTRRGRTRKELLEALRRSRESHDA